VSGRAQNLARARCMRWLVYVPQRRGNRVYGEATLNGDGRWTVARDAGSDAFHPPAVGVFAGRQRTEPVCTRVHGSAAQEAAEKPTHGASTVRAACAAGSTRQAKIGCCDGYTRGTGFQ
jgi:hypothetical protein